MSRRKPAANLTDQALDWARAIALGIRDTAQSVLSRGRDGAAEAYDEAWERYDDKTKRRRRRP